MTSVSAFLWEDFLYERRSYQAFLFLLGCVTLIDPIVIPECIQAYCDHFWMAMGSYRLQAGYRHAYEVFTQRVINVWKFFPNHVVSAPNIALSNIN